MLRNGALGAICGTTTRGPHIKPPSKCANYPLMRETAELDRLLTQVSCRITSVIRLRDARAISKCEAERELKQGVAVRAELMRQIDGQEVAFDA